MRSAISLLRHTVGQSKSNKVQVMRRIRGSPFAQLWPSARLVVVPRPPRVEVEDGANYN